MSNYSAQTPFSCEDCTHEIIACDTNRLGGSHSVCSCGAVHHLRHSDSFNTVYLAGVRFLPDKSIISQERIVAYERNGALRGSIYDIPEIGETVASTKALKSAAGGVNVVFEDDEFALYEESFDNEADATLMSSKRDIVLEFVGVGESRELGRMDSTGMMVHDVAPIAEGQGGFLVLDLRGRLIEGRSDSRPRLF